LILRRGAVLGERPVEMARVKAGVGRGDARQRDPD
jgi:hypothetical protein